MGVLIGCKQPKTKPVAWNHLLFMFYPQWLLAVVNVVVGPFAVFPEVWSKPLPLLPLRSPAYHQAAPSRKTKYSFIIFTTQEWSHFTFVSMWKKATDEIFYLWNWILCRCWRLIPAEIRQSSTFRHSVQPDAFINLSFVRVVELSISVLFATPPGAVKPVSIYLKTSVKFLNSTVSLGQSFF